VKGLVRHQGLYIPITQSGLSKKRTAEANIRDTEVYPHIHIHNYCNGNRLKESMATEDRLKDIRLEHKQEMIKGRLYNKKEWQTHMQHTKMKPYQTQAPLTKTDGKVITNHYEYIKETLKCIEKATQQTLMKTNPKHIDIRHER
jgi:hypothetical protein